MSIPQVYQVAWMEDGTAHVMARLSRPNLSTFAMQRIVQADVSSVVRHVLEADGTIITGPTSLTVSAVIYDTLQGAGGTGLWTKDTTGFNFYDAPPPASFPAGEELYRVEYKVTLTSGEVFQLLFEGEAVPVLAT